MIYYLDTNICVYMINNKYPHLNRKFADCDKSNIKMPSVVYHELCYGVEKSKRRERSAESLLIFSREIEIVTFDEQAAEIAGKIRAGLERKGQVIGGNDILIAATALSNGAILVTNNTREFERVGGLFLENWVE